jgi:hypothetical protein
MCEEDVRWKKRELQPFDRSCQENEKKRKVKMIVNNRCA